MNNKIQRIYLLLCVSILSTNFFAIPVETSPTDVNNQIDLLKEKIIAISDECWKKPVENRKDAMNKKLSVLQELIWEENYSEAYNKLLHDIKPKLTGLKTDESEEAWDKGVFKNPWSQCPILQEELRIICNMILTDLRALIEGPEPYVDDDTNPPEILLTPSVVITDEEAIGGFTVQWEITDASGIAQASVILNGDIVVNYGSSDYILGSLVLTNSLRVNTIEVFARDNDNDPEHPEGVDWLESSAQTAITVIDDDTSAPIITIDYVGSGTDFDPGWWIVTVEDSESGLAEITILVNGFEIEYEENLNGQISYQIDTPASVGTHTIEVIAINNDNDREGDQESSTDTDSVSIIPDPIFGIPWP